MWQLAIVVLLAVATIAWLLARASVYPCEPLVSYRINQQLSGSILPPLMIRTSEAHCQKATSTVRTMLLVLSSIVAGLEKLSVAKPSVLSRVLKLLTLGSLTSGSALTYSQGVPAPKGLDSCAPSDALAVRGTRAAVGFGGDLVGCFKSEKKIWVGGGVDLTASLPFEVATAFDLPGPYTLADLEKLLEPISKSLEED